MRYLILIILTAFITYMVIYVKTIAPGENSYMYMENQLLDAMNELKVCEFRLNGMNTFGDDL